MRLFGNAIQNYFGALNITAPVGFNPITINAAAGISCLQLVGAAASQLNGLQLTQGAQSPWLLYQPASSTDLRYFSNGSDRFAFLAAGGFSTTGASTLNVASGGTPLSMSDGTINTAIELGGTTLQIGTLSNHPLSWYTNNATRFTLSAAGGLFAQGATGGDKGVGTGNFTGVFVNGTAIAASAVIGIIQIGFNGGSNPTILGSKNLGASPSITRTAIGTYTVTHNMALATQPGMSLIMNNGGASIFLPQGNAQTGNSFVLTTQAVGTGIADPANTYTCSVILTTG